MSPAITKLLQNNIRSIAVLLSLLISAWVIGTDDVINTDGILYLRSAAFMQLGDWTTAMAYYSWPLYSALIALISQLAGIGLESAGHWLNTLLFALTVYSFITVVQELGGERDAQLIAALLILLYPELNENRADIFRDNGYWAFYLLSLALFLRYYAQLRLRTAIAWGASMIVAILFRIEGVAMLALLPLVLLVRHDLAVKQRLLAVAQAWIVPLLGLLIGLLWLAASPDTLPQDTGRLAEPLKWLSYLGSELSTRIEMQADALSAAILNRYSEEYALLAMLAVLLTLLLQAVGSALGPVFVLLIAYSLLARRYWSGIPATLRPLLGWLMAINLLVLAPFLGKYFFLTGRYVMPLALTLLLPMPALLAEFYADWRNDWHHLGYRQKSYQQNSDQQDRYNRQRRRIRQGLLALVIVACSVLAVDGLYSFGRSKAYLREAGQWLAGQVITGQHLFSNNLELNYYAQAKPGLSVVVGDTDKLLALFSNGDWKNFDYLAIQLGNAAQVQRILASVPVGLKLANKFENNRGDQLLVFVRDPH